MNRKCKDRMRQKYCGVRGKKNQAGQINKYNQHRINFNRKQVIYMKPDIEKIIQVMISLLEEQEKVKITYTIEKTA